MVKLKDKNKPSPKSAKSSIVSQGLITTCTITVEKDLIVPEADAKAFLEEVEALQVEGYGIEVDPQKDGSLLVEAQETSLSHWEKGHGAFAVIPPKWAKKTVVTKPYQPPIKGQE